MNRLPSPWMCVDLSFRPWTRGLVVLITVASCRRTLSITVYYLLALIELKSVFDQIQAAEKAGNLNPEEKKRLEESAAEKGLQALFKGAKLEIESVLRETCDRVLANPTLSPKQRHLRALALQILGDAYVRARKDGEGESGETEYVRVDTKASRDRDRTGRS